MGSSQKETVRLYEQAKGDIAVDIDLILRWAAAHSYMIDSKYGHDAESLPIIKDLDMKGAFFTAYNVRLSTFFQNGGSNSLSNLIAYAHELKKIDSNAASELTKRLKTLLASDACKQLNDIRNTVIAHWKRNEQPEQQGCIETMPVITEVRAIFKECGGEEHDSKADMAAVRSTNLLFSIVRGFAAFRASLERSKDKADKL